MPLTKVEAIKKYMGAERPVTFEELKDLVKGDKAGYEWMAKECAKALGETIQ